MKRLLSAFLLTLSLAAQAGLPPTTLSGQSATVKPTTFTFKTPYNQSTQISGIESMVETGSENMFVNPGFEGVASTVPNGWTCTVGTCTKTTTSGEFSSGKAAMKVALSAQTMNVSQTITPPTGIQKQGFARVIYRVPSTMADFQVCTLVDAAEQTCVPSANLILDDTFRSIEIPLTFGSTSAGIKFKTTSSYTANAYFDGAIIAQGLGLQNLMLDNVYSAFITSPTTISLTNKPGWISSVVNNSAGDYTVNFPVGQFSVAPSCVCTVQGGSSRTCSTYSVGTGSINVQTLNVSLQNNNFNLICQKSGNDYLASSANVYSQASGAPQYSHYSDGAGNGSTATKIPYFSTLSNSSGSSLYTCTNSSTNGLSCTFLQPANVRVSVTCYGPSGDQCGISRNASSLTTNIYTLADSERIAYSYVSASTAATATTNIIVNTGDVIRPHTSGQTITDANSWLFTISATQANSVIVGSFENVPTVPGAGVRIDTFSVSYGTTNATTACTGTPCFIDQIGNAVSSVARVSTGLYDLITFKTYLKLKCTGNTGSGVELQFPNNGSTNSNTIRFQTDNFSTVINSYGMLTCQGTY